MLKRILILTVALGVGVVFTAETATVSKNKPDLSQGKKIYETNLCITCHGATGKGDGAAAAALTKKPRDFSDTVYMAKEGMEKLRKSIALGGGSVGLSPLMTGFKGTLKDKQIDEVLDYLLKTFSGKGSAKFEEIIKAAGKPDLSQGKKIYETNLCITCHGATGKGDGAAAAALTKKPRDFSDTVYMAKEGMEKLRKSIALGGGSVGLSPLMTGFKGTLKDKQIDEVLDYLLTTFSGKGSAKFQEIIKAAEKPDLSQGKKIYETNLCITCHGATGKGDGAAAAALTKKPRDFNDTVYMAREGMEKLRKSIALGGGSVGLSPLMTGFKGTLKDKQIDEVLDYLLTTFSGKGSAKFQEIIKAAEKPKAERKTQ